MNPVSITIYIKADESIAPKSKAVLKRLTEHNWNRFGSWSSFFAKNTDNKKVKMVDINKRDDDFWRVKYTAYRDPFGEAMVVNPQKASQVYSRLWDPRWNVFGVKQLTEILENVKINTIDKDYFKKNDIENSKYFQDVIEILGEIGDTSVIQTLKGYLKHPDLGQYAEKAIEQINT